MIDTIDTIDTIEKLSSDYNKFMDMSREQSDEIEDVIDIKGINEVNDLIKKFQEKLNNSVNAPQRSTVAETTDITLQKLKNIPLVGNLLEGEIKKAEKRLEEHTPSRQILRDMFDIFKDKSVMLEKTFEKADKLRTILIQKEKLLYEFSNRVRYIIENDKNNLSRIKAISLGGMIESNKLKNKEKIYNKLDFILQFIEEQLTTIALMMPSIETGLVEDNEIGQFLASVNDMNKVFSGITELSNSVSIDSNKKIMNLITEVSESMTNVVDIHHLEKLAETNATFMKKLAQSTEKKIKQDAQVYQKLVTIGGDLDQVTIQYNETNKKILENTLGV